MCAVGLGLEILLLDSALISKPFGLDLSLGLGLAGLKYETDASQRVKSLHSKTISLHFISL